MYSYEDTQAKPPPLTDIARVQVPNFAWYVRRLLFLSKEDSTIFTAYFGLNSGKWLPMEPKKARILDKVAHRFPRFKIKAWQENKKYFFSSINSVLENVFLRLQ